MSSVEPRLRRRGSKRNREQAVPEPVQERAAPTVEALIEATIAVLDEADEPSVRVDDILDATGISRGSLYHHFGDRDGLVDAARAVQYARIIDEDIEAIRAALAGATDAMDFARRMTEVSLITQSPDRASQRLRRLEIIAATRTRPRLAEALAQTQHRLTSALAEAVTEAQARGWVSPGLDARAVAVFVQAYSLGRVVTEIDSEPVPLDVWLQLIGRVSTDVFGLGGSPNGNGSDGSN